MRTDAGKIIAAVFIAEVTATFESAMLYAALPTLIRDFGDPVTASWLVTIHVLVGSVACIVAGRLGDIFGRRRVMLIVLAIATIGSIASSVTTSFAIVMAGRALQGLSVAALPLTIGILRESLPAERVPIAVGLMTTAQGVGTASGLVLGGAIVDHFNWHWLFAASAALLVISLIAVRVMVPAHPGAPPRNPIDWIEGLLPAPAVAALLLAISLSKDLGWLQPKVLGFLILGFVLLALFAVRSLRSSEPFVDLRMLRERNIAIANVISVLLALGTMQAVFVFSTYLQAPLWTAAGLGFSATVAGLAKLPSNFLSFFAGPFSGWLMVRRDIRWPIILGAVMAAVGWTAALGMPSGLASVIVILCIISFGTSILNTIVPNVILLSAPADRTSEAIGANSVIRGMFAAIGTQVLAVLLASQTVAPAGGGPVFPSADGYRLAMVWIIVLTTIAGACALLLCVRQAGRKEPSWKGEASEQ